MVFAETVASFIVVGFTLCVTSLELSSKIGEEATSSFAKEEGLSFPFVNRGIDDDVFSINSCLDFLRVLIC